MSRSSMSNKRDNLIRDVQSAKPGEFLRSNSAIRADDQYRMRQNLMRALQDLPSRTCPSNLFPVIPPSFPTFTPHSSDVLFTVSKPPLSFTHNAESYDRMWHESESRSTDFTRLANLVRSQLFFSLNNEPKATWLSLEQDLLESDYSVIRERQMEMLEKEDGIMGKEGVRGLREMLGREAYEVVSDQRYVLLM
jgi:hypothetical protein